MKQALDAIETYGPEYMHGLSKKHYTKTLRQAIAEAEKQEPVHASDMSEEHVHKSDKDQLIKQAEEAFESAKERGWVGLTDDEIYDYADKFLYQHGSNYGIKSFGKAIEAKLKEKNT
jgi:hypothetical protein